MSVLHRNIKP